MKHLLAMTIVFCLSACASLPDTQERTPAMEFNKTYVDSNSKIWVSSEYKQLDVAPQGVHIFVQEFRPWVPDYFVIINEAPEQNKLSLFNAHDDGWSFQEADREVLGGITFVVRSGPYNLLQSGDGGYLGVIDSTKFNSPKCGYVKRYEAIHAKPLTIDFIDMASCGDLHSEISMYHEQVKMDKQLREQMSKYLNAYHARIATANSKAVSAFGIDR